MIAELGLAALWLAAALSVLQLVAGALGQRENSGELATSDINDRCRIADYVS